MTSVWGIQRGKNEKMFLDNGMSINVENCFSQTAVTRLVEQAKNRGSKPKYKWFIKQDAFVQRQVDELVRLYQKA